MKNVSMKNGARSALCLLLAAAAIFGLAACTGGTPVPADTSGGPDSAADTAEPTETVAPAGTEPEEQAEKKPYYITYYYGIPDDYVSNERYQEAIDAGFNLLQIEKGTTEQKQEALRYCEEQGVKAIVHDYRITTRIMYNFWEMYLDNREALEEEVRGVCEDFRDYPAVYGYYLIDEPGADKFPLIAAVVELIHKYDPGRICYVNLFPDYATPRQLFPYLEYE